MALKLRGSYEPVARYHVDSDSDASSDSFDGDVMSGGGFDVLVARHSKRKRIAQDRRKPSPEELGEIDRTC